MITETVWLTLMLIFGIWVVLLGFGRKEQIIGVFGSFVGLFFGFTLMTLIGVWIGMIMIFLNIYLAYEAIFRGHSK